MSKTFQELESEQGRENRERELALINHVLEQNLIDKWHAAWVQFCRACLKQLSADESKQAVFSLVEMFKDNALLLILKDNACLMGP